jgi:hypothetical protein
MMKKAKTTRTNFEEISFIPFWSRNIIKENCNGMNIGFNLKSPLKMNLWPSRSVY